MSEDQPFRIILIVGAVILLPIAAYHRLKSQATGERLDRRPEGFFLLLTVRPVGVITMLGLIAYMSNPTWMAWSSVALPAWMRWTGIGLGLMAGLLLTWTLRSLGRNLTDTVVTRREHTLVTSGPYRWVRHPFYSSLALSVVANALAAANWFVFAGGALLFALIAVRTRKEEEHLLTRFGDAYRRYMERTGRFLPRIDGRSHFAV